MAERKTFLLGGAVTFSDGVVGRLQGLQVQPDWTPTSLLVLVPGRWPWQRGRLLRLPAETAAEFRAEETALSVASSEGEPIPAAGPPHAEGEAHWLDATGRFQVATGPVERQSAYFLGLVLEGDGSVRLLGEAGTLARRRILVPAEVAVYQRHGFVWVELKGESLDTMPTYEPGG